MEWEVNGEKFGNHYLSGTAPRAFDAAKVAK